MPSTADTTKPSQESSSSLTAELIWSFLHEESLFQAVPALRGLQGYVRQADDWMKKMGILRDPLKPPQEVPSCSGCAKWKARAIFLKGIDHFMRICFGLQDAGRIPELENLRCYVMGRMGSPHGILTLRYTGPCTDGRARTVLLEP